MNESTKQALNDFVQNLIKATETAGNFAVEQAPLLVQEWLRWQIIMGVVGALIGTVGIGLTTYLLVGGIKRANKENDINAQVVVGFIFSIFTLVTMPGWAPLIAAGLKAYIAPRVVILEKFSEFLR